MDATIIFKKEEENGESEKRWRWPEEQEVLVYFMQKGRIRLLTYRKTAIVPGITLCTCVRSPRMAQ